MDINFELYKIFYLVAKHQSFTEAAEKLFISQSAVSQAVKNLEEKIGDQLFIRKSRSVKLTTEGELLFKHIEQAYNFIKAGEEKLVEIKNLDCGEIRIGVGDTICKYFLVTHLENFNQMYPKIKIQVTNRTSSQILSLLKSGEIDVGIVTLPVKDSSLYVKEFITVDDIFVACNKFRELTDRKIPIKELVSYPLLMLPKGSTTRSNIDALFKENKISFKPEIELESIDLLVEFAKIGLGVAHVLKESALSSIKSNELFIIKTKEHLPARKLGIAVQKDIPVSRAVEEFLRILGK